jgi:hypothetical protein
MKTYLYLSLIPEALIASMLPPKEFGAYRAVGTMEATHGPEIFFEVEGLEKEDTPFPLEDIEKQCVPHPDGTPKRSVYLAIYRVLEHIPVHTLKRVYLVTRDGRVLGIDQSSQLPEFSGTYHLYQELCPAHPQIASTLDPADFARYLTDPNSNLHVPRVAFADLQLGELAEDIEHGNIFDLPYGSVEHLRDCLRQLKTGSNKKTKTVDRTHPYAFPYRAIKNGIFVGGGEKIGFYKFPSQKELQSTYYQWWRSASMF